MNKIPILFGVFMILIVNVGHAGQFTPGVHYEILDKAQPIVDNNKIEVRELFWYYCPHCFDLEPYVEQYKKTKPDNIAFVQQPAVFAARWEKGAVFYYVLEALDRLDLHSELFDAIHLNNIIFNGKGDLVDWLADHGVDREKAAQAYDSFSVRVKVKKAKKDSQRYGVNGVPAFIG